MATKAPDIVTRSPRRERFLRELQDVLFLTVYLYIAIGALNVMKAAVLHDNGVAFAYWGVAIVKALLLAKFVMLGKALKVGEHKKRDPLIWPTLHKVFAFLLLLIALTLAEEVVMGWFHHRSMAESLGALLGDRLAETLANVLILLLLLVPYFALLVLSEALGGDRLRKMFFVDRDAS